jgi:3,4-dihydroxy 2-butanone 4-phosphate synthase
MPSKLPQDPVFDSITSCISAFVSGNFIIVLDSPSRENEGDLIIAAQDVTTEKMAFMIRHSSGLICTPLNAERARTLELPQMVTENADPNRTAYTVSVDANREGVTTGISAADRALTCRVLADPGAGAPDLRRPGHMFPLRAREGGVRQRPGHTEAAVDFCRLAGKREVGVICELVEDGAEGAEGVAERLGGGMMRRDACLEFGRRWGLKVCTIEDLVRYLEEKDRKEGKLQGAANGINGT